MWTFTLSAFMHGFNAQIWSVLISLAVLSWLELRIREKLASTFSACVRARRCKARLSDGRFKQHPLQTHWPRLRSAFGLRKDQTWRCSAAHRHTECNSWLVNCVNLCFSLLAVLHLAFLGSAFDGSEQSATAAHVYEIWSYLGFYSHVIGLICLVLYKLI